MSGLPRIWLFNRIYRWSNPSIYQWPPPNWNWFRKNGAVHKRKSTPIGSDFIFIPPSKSFKWYFGSDYRLEALNSFSPTVIIPGLLSKGPTKKSPKWCWWQFQRMYVVNMAKSITNSSNIRPTCHQHTPNQFSSPTSFANMDVGTNHL